MICITINLNELEDVVSRDCYLLPGKTFLNNTFHETVLCVDIVPNIIRRLPQTCKLDLVIKYKEILSESKWHCTCDCINDGIKNKKCIYYIQKANINIK